MPCFDATLRHYTLHAMMPLLLLRCRHGIATSAFIFVIDIYDCRRRHADAAT